MSDENTQAHGQQPSSPAPSQPNLTPFRGFQQSSGARPTTLAEAHGATVVDAAPTSEPELTGDR